MRSRSNIVFRIRDDNKLAAKFIQEAESAGFVGLEAFTNTSTCCISLNNHTPFEGVYAMIAFMETFKRHNL